MTWIRRQPPDRSHRCEPPTREAIYRFPSMAVSADPPIVTEHREQVVDGALGDLWGCDDCGRLWRIGYACGACDRYGYGRHGGGHEVGERWRPATWWQRLRHRSRLLR